MDDSDTPNNTEKPEGPKDNFEPPKAKGLKLPDLGGKPLDDMPKDSRTALKQAHESIQSPLFKALAEPKSPLLSLMRELGDSRSALSRAMRGQQEQMKTVSEAISRQKREVDQLSAIARGLSPQSLLPLDSSYLGLGTLTNLGPTTHSLAQMLNALTPSTRSLAEQANVAGLSMTKNISAYLGAAMSAPENLTRSLAFMTAAMGRYREPLITSSAVGQLLREAREATARIGAFNPSVLLAAMGQAKESNIRIGGLGATSLLAALLATGTPTTSSLHSMNEAAVLTSEALAVVPDSQAWAAARAESPVVDAVAAFSELDAEARATPEQFIAAIDRIVDARIQGLGERSGVTTLWSIVLFISWLTAWVAPMIQTAYYRYLDGQKPEIGQQIETGIRDALKPLEDLLQKHLAELDAASTVICIAEPAANIRSAPSTQNAVIGKMASGQHAAVIGAAKGWRQVEFVDSLTGATIKGWVAKRLLQDVTLVGPEVEG